MRYATWLTLLGLLAAVGCGPETATAPTAATKPSANDEDDHNHGKGPHGGTVIELGKFHGEFVVDHAKKEATVYLLDGKVKDPKPAEGDELTLTLTSPKVQIPLKPVPLDTDPKGKSSRFVGTHDALGKEQEFAGSVSGLLDGKPRLGEFKQKPAAHGHEHGKAKPPAMPVAKRDDERKLYLVPGGRYTAADVAANGNTVVSVKYRGFRARHDIEPKPGDPLCPITLTKASDELRWVVGGQTYKFCCPPCVEEFVMMAKEKPAEIKPPGEYVKK